MAPGPYRVGGGVTPAVLPPRYVRFRIRRFSSTGHIGRLAPLPRLYPLPVRQASTLPAASFRFAVARDTLAVRLTLPLAGCVEDSHLQVVQLATTASQTAPDSALRAMSGAPRRQGASRRPVIKLPPPGRTAVSCGEPRNARLATATDAGQDRALLLHVGIARVQIASSWAKSYPLADDAVRRAR